MAKRTLDKLDGKKSRSGHHNYANNEIARAKRDIYLWALDHAKSLGADTRPIEDPVDRLSSRFWMFVIESTPHGCFDNERADSQQSRANRRQRLISLKTAVGDLAAQLETVKADLRPPRALPGVRRADGLLDPCESSVVVVARKVLELLDKKADRVLANQKRTKDSPRSIRGAFVRRVLESPEGTGGWWPAEPTNKDLAAMSVLTRVAFETFEDDFSKRIQFARYATGARSGIAGTHLQGFAHNEVKRCRGLRPKTSAK